MTEHILAQRYLFSVEAIVFSLLSLWLWLFYRGYGRQYVKFWTFSLIALACSYTSLALQDNAIIWSSTPFSQLILLTLEQLSKYSYLFLLLGGVHSAVSNISFSNKRVLSFVFFASLLSLLTLMAFLLADISLFNRFYIHVSLQNFIFGCCFLFLSFYLLTTKKKHFSNITLMIFALIIGLRYLLYSFASILFMGEESFADATYFLTFFDAGSNTVLAFIMLIWMQSSERYTAINAVRRAQYLGKHDSLTGVLNREQALEKLETEMPKALQTDQRLCICLIDMKRFKFVNDTYGLKTGDYILGEIANRLTDSVLMPKVVGRLSGDSFLFVIETPNQQQLDNSLEHIHQLIARPYEYNAQNIIISCSIGYCFYPKHADLAEDLLQKANLALHHAENNHLASVLFIDGMHTQGRKLILVEQEIKQAFTNNELILHFQPQLNLITNRLEGVEALVRWQHPEKGLLAPDQFLPDIESLGLNNKLDNYVLDKACQAIAHWHEKYKRRVTIAINMSAMEFQNPKLINNIQSLLFKYNIPPKYIDLEITENVVMTDINTAMDTIIILQNMGIKVSIDDFGTGYSSLAYLRALPIDKIKIDRSFITEVTINDSDLTIVKSMIELSHGLGKRVLAEGVENADQLNLLRNIGCDAVQGYFISRPLDESSIAKFLKRK
ncbi:MAG: bifunctional diguanylate cyclase/phosphodiesterase [Alteromonadaceae bacterium]|nr:bifunctional diguanylate cyclase/phosphodiesterase [Alteromonadaceae bacterium]